MAEDVSFRCAIFLSVITAVLLNVIFMYISTEYVRNFVNITDVEGGYAPVNETELKANFTDETVYTDIDFATCTVNQVRLLSDTEKEQEKKDGNGTKPNSKIISSVKLYDSKLYSRYYMMVQCNLTEDCIYGAYYNITCVDSCGITQATKAMCRYCYQTNTSEHTCVQKAICESITLNKRYYKTNCTVHSDVICLGNRTFLKKLKCGWTRGHRWSTALLLSILGGGFGLDRFYLGYWKEAIGKICSFGGFGIWTIVDAVLIATRYLGPEDGSLYI